MQTLSCSISDGEAKVSYSRVNLVSVCLSRTVIFFKTFVTEEKRFSASMSCMSYANNFFFSIVIRVCLLLRKVQGKYSRKL